VRCMGVGARCARDEGAGCGGTGKGLVQVQRYCAKSVIINNLMRPSHDTTSWSLRPCRDETKKRFKHVILGALCFGVSWHRCTYYLMMRTMLMMLLPLPLWHRCSCR
jgi:hypothetical protein